MNAETIILEALAEAVLKLYGTVPDPELLQVQGTRKEFEGDVTVVVFTLLKISRKSPQQTGMELGQALTDMLQEIASFQVIQGFLNLKMTPEFWTDTLQQMAATPEYGMKAPSGKTVMVEYSSPNTNKPLHLGHIRNNLLGWSVSRIMEANGHRVIKVNLVNDREFISANLCWPGKNGEERNAGNGRKKETIW